MAAPSIEDYQHAIGDLSTICSDTELRDGQPESGPMGMPLFFAGNFACVFKVYAPSTNKTWAIKCFTREVAGLGERYREIQAHLDRSHLPFMVEFEYVEPGIRIAGRWRPFLKMRWVEGLSLDQLIAQHIDHPKTLAQLVSLWFKLSVRLRQAEIAHCDLRPQHVLFEPDPKTGKLSTKLIDYDGMFVPSLTGHSTTQAGHACFHHPQSLAVGVGGMEADRFSHLVIYTTLKCLVTAGPRLWNQFHDEDTLLMHPPDLASPEASPLMRQLWGLEDVDARHMVGHLILAGKGSFDAIPRLDELVNGSDVKKLTSSERQRIDRALTTGKWGKPETRMCQALSTAKDIVEEFVQEIPRCFPPVVFNISGGCATDGDPQIAAAALREVASANGNVLLFNIYVASGDRKTFQFAHSEKQVGSEHARELFWMSSLVPQGMARDLESVEPGRIESPARCFAVNAGMIGFAQTLEIGTRVGGSGWNLAEISESNPACLLFLVDQSDRIYNSNEPGYSVSETVADILNSWIRALCLRASKGVSLTDYFYIGALGYGDELGPALNGPLKEMRLIPISLVAEHPMRVDRQKVMQEDGEGGVIEREVRRPIWYDKDSRFIPLAEDTPPASAVAHKSLADETAPLVFISAKSEDYPHAQRFYEYLTSKGVRAFLGSVSLAQQGVSDYRKMIDNALDEARHMIVVTSSPQHVRSSWVEAEWGLFVNEKRSDRKTGNLITVIVGQMRIEQLPPSLRNYEVIPDGPAAFEKVFSYVSR